MSAPLVTVRSVPRRQSTTPSAHLVGIFDRWAPDVPSSQERLAIFRTILRKEYREARHLGLLPSDARQFAIGAIAAWHTTVTVYTV